MKVDAIIHSDPDTLRSKLGRYTPASLNALPGGGYVSVKDIASRFKISHETLGRLTGFSLRAVCNWSQGRKRSSSTSRRLTEVNRLFAALEELVASEAIGPWLKTPSPAFDGSTPLQVIERGEADRIRRMVYELQSCEPG